MRWCAAFHLGACWLVHVLVCCCLLCASVWVAQQSIQLRCRGYCTELICALLKFDTHIGLQQRRLPPWVVLDGSGVDNAALQSQQPQLPAIPMHLVQRAMDESHSYFFRNPRPDFDAGTPLVWSAGKSGLQTAPLPTPMAAVEAHLPALDPGTHYKPIFLPPQAVDPMVQDAHNTQKWDVTPKGATTPQVVALLRVPTSHDGAIKYHPMCIEPNRPVPPPPDAAQQRSLEELEKLLGDDEPVQLLNSRCKHTDKPQYQFKKLEDADPAQQYEISALIGGDVIGVGRGALQAPHCSFLPSAHVSMLTIVAMLRASVQLSLAVRCSIAVARYRTMVEQASWWQLLHILVDALVHVWACVCRQEQEGGQARSRLACTRLQRLS